MNVAEHLFCSSAVWRQINNRKLLPWVLFDHDLGDHLLELGAGYGAATPYLKSRVSRVTSLEYDHNSLRKLKARSNGSSSAVCADASQLPFAPATFSSAVAILMLHHLKSPELQDQMFAEVFRSLCPGGVFLAFDIRDSWLQKVGHIRSTFTPVAPNSLTFRLTSAGFFKISVDARPVAFRFSAIRPAE
jgi:ubiquinone/menaquinone biosynthesis C-methylase UbiE